MLLLQPHGFAMFSLQSLSFKPLLLDWSVESNITYEYQQMQNETVFSEGSTDMLLSIAMWMALLVGVLLICCFAAGLQIGRDLGCNNSIKGKPSKVENLFKLPNRETLHFYDDCSGLKHSMKEPVSLPLCETCIKRKL